MMTHDFEYGVNSRYKNKKERESDSITLMQARLEKMKNLPKKTNSKSQTLAVEIENGKLP